jgi:hypothetical protein
MGSVKNCQTNLDETHYGYTKKVNKNTRAGQNGKELICPNCGKRQKVYHFAFIACTCQKCKQLVNKYDWLLPVK